MTDVSAVIFDLGGVVLSSPLHGFAAYEKELNLERGELGRLLDYTNNDGLFASLERNQISFEQYCKRAEQTFVSNFKGSEIPPFSARKMIEAIENASSVVDKNIIGAIDKLRQRGILCCALTNNWFNTTVAEILPTHQEMFANTAHEQQQLMNQLMEHFDVFLESRVLGQRKPEIALYKHTLQQLQEKSGEELPPSSVIFVDDIGTNLKPMKELGVHTILARNTQQVIKDIETRLGFSLSD
jgi:epoxide hydrolase-like predicted phosphatase